jgi:hypothetical protein
MDDLVVANGGAGISLKNRLTKKATTNHSTIYGGAANRTFSEYESMATPIGLLYEYPKEIQDFFKGEPAGACIDDELFDKLFYNVHSETGKTEKRGKNMTRKR